MDFGIHGKRIEILKQAVPNLERAGVLNSRGKPLYRRDSQWAHHVEADARSVGVELEFAEAARMISMTRSPH